MFAFDSFKLLQKLSSKDKVCLNHHRKGALEAWALKNGCQVGEMDRPWEWWKSWRGRGTEMHAWGRGLG